jgi:hydrocephalus-inducing protein
MIFEYTPNLPGKHEGNYIFEIPHRTIKIREFFLLKGLVKDPNIFFDVGKINFGPLLLGGRGREKVNLKNLEHIPFFFKFDKSSIFGNPEYANSLSVEP